MKKYLFTTLFISTTVSTSAQWYGFSPQIYNDPCVQSSINAAQSSNWVMQSNQAIMQQQQTMINNGWYSSPNNSNKNSTTSRRPPRREKRTCGTCDGKGWIPETKGVASFGQTKWCNRCDKKVSSSHYHATCPSCKGNGKL